MLNKKNGYTLIEVLVAVTIFFTVVAAPTGFFIGSIRGQQKTLADQELLDNISYSMEYISRSLRMAKKESALPPDYVCIDTGSNYQIISDGQQTGIKFKNYKGDCQEFFVQEDPQTNTHRLYEKITNSSGEEEEEIPLTPSALEIVSFKIIPQDGTGWDQEDDFQPRITIFIHMAGTKIQSTSYQSNIKIQTTISQRDLDVNY